MNEELQKKLLDYLGHLEAGIEKAVDFGAGQAPLVIQEIIQYNLVYHSVASVFWTFVAISLLCVVRLAWKLDKSKWAHHDAAGIVFAGVVIPLASLAPVLIFGVLENGASALTCWIAPRLFTLEYLSDLVR